MGAGLRAGLPNVGAGQGRNRLGAAFAARADRYHGRAVAPRRPGTCKPGQGSSPAGLPPSCLPQRRRCARGVQREARLGHGFAPQYWLWVL